VSSVSSVSSGSGSPAGGGSLDGAHPVDVDADADADVDADAVDSVDLAVGEPGAFVVGGLAGGPLHGVLVGGGDGQRDADLDGGVVLDAQDGQAPAAQRLVRAWAADVTVVDRLDDAAAHRRAELVDLVPQRVQGSGGLVALAAGAGEVGGQVGGQVGSGVGGGHGVGGGLRSHGGRGPLGSRWMLGPG
jgi:hypothetical protein